MIVVVTTQMRVGSTWLCRLLCDLLDTTKWTFVRSLDELKREVKKLGQSFYVIKMHQEHPRDVIDKCDKVISITRDVRDIIVSRAFFQNRRIQKRDPTSYGKQIVSSFFKKEGEWVIDSWKRYNDGYENPDYLLLSYKDLKENTRKELRKICDFLGIFKTESQLINVVQRNSFEKLSGGRKPGNERGNDFLRKGIVGDWKNYLKKEHLEKIKNSLVSTE